MVARYEHVIRPNSQLVAKYEHVIRPNSQLVVRYEHVIRPNSQLVVRLGIKGWKLGYILKRQEKVLK